jgi:hypothetical protein
MDNYFHMWQLPLILIFFFGWLVGGGYLFQRKLVDKTGNKKIKISKGVLISFLTGLAGVIAAAIAYKIGDSLSGTEKGLSILGVILMVPTYLLMSYLVVYAMFKMTGRETLSVCVTPLLATVLLTGGVGAACGIPAYYIQRDRLAQAKLVEKTMDNFRIVFRALMTRPNDLPASLDELVDQKLVDPEVLKSPAKSNRAKGFFYYKPSRLGVNEGKEFALLICDFKDTHESGHRVVMYLTGRSEPLGESAFQEMLRKPENMAFAAALRNAEGK